MRAIGATTAWAGGVWVAACAAPCSAQWWWPPTNGSLMNPSCPAPMAPIWLGVSGNFPDTCVPTSVTVVRTGTDIDLTFNTTTSGQCAPTLSPWALVASLGPLPEGSYPVYATYVRDGTPMTQRVLIRTIAVSPTCPPGCYPNCDRSTTTPYLNFNDFTCFMQRFAAGDLYANCDGSSEPPVLNVADFSCFLLSFSGGCH